MHSSYNFLSTHILCIFYCILGGMHSSYNFLSTHILCIFYCRTSSYSFALGAMLSARRHVRRQAPGEAPGEAPCEAPDAMRGAGRHLHVVVSPWQSYVANKCEMMMQAFSLGKGLCTLHKNIYSFILYFVMFMCHLVTFCT
jgi:hypothetical protein